VQYSIIIPTLNEASNITRLLHYLQQNGPQHLAEIWVVDGNSSDNTVEKAQKAGAKVLQLPASSRAAQMNAGARAATSDVLYFVHADTLPPTSLDTDIAREIASGEVMGCYRYRFDSPRWILKFNAYFVRFKWLWCQGGDKTFFVTRSVFEEFGGYDERFVVMEEYDFLRKATQKYRLRVLTPEVLVSARKYEKNSWLRVQLANIGAFALFRWQAEPNTIKRFYRRMLRS